MLLGVFVPIVILTTTGILQATEVTTSPLWSRILFYVFFILDPLFSFFVGNFYFVYMSLVTDPVWPTQVIPIRPTVLNTALVCLFQCVFYMIITLIIDCCRTNNWRRRSGRNPKNALSYAKLAVYDDALNHAEKVKRSPNYPNHQYMMKAENITKVYDTNLLAVAGNTFGVPRGGVMGLLGPNGAGKSTTFSIMAMQQGRTEGHAYIEGKEIEDMDLVTRGKYISMCP